MSRKHIDTVNPLTGEVDTVGCLRFIVETLNAQEDIEKRGLYHILRGSMSGRLKSLNIKSFPEVLLLMQELGLLRRWGAQKTTSWSVVDASYFDKFVTPEWFERAARNVTKHSDMVMEIRLLRERLNKLKLGDTSENTEINENGASQPDVDAMAEMVAEAEQLRAALSARDETIKALEEALAAKDDPKAVAAALVERYKKGTAS